MPSSVDQLPLSVSPSSVSFKVTSLSPYISLHVRTLSLNSTSLSGFVPWAPPMAPLSLPSSFLRTIWALISFPSGSLAVRFHLPAMSAAKADTVSVKASSRGAMRIVNPPKYCMHETETGCKIGACIAHCASRPPWRRGSRIKCGI